MLVDSDIPRFEVELLLMHVLDVERSYLQIHPEKCLSQAQQNTFDTLLQRRAKGEPMAYLFGTKEFWSLDLLVNEACLIPRPETELLVELVTEQFAKEDALMIADLGTGSGAIALAIASECKKWQIIATDKSPSALTLARENARRLQIDNVDFLEGNWCEPLTPHTFHGIVSNPPYIAKNDPHLRLGSLPYEPSSALVGGEDGLDAIRIIIATAPRYLKPGGWIFIEHGHNQGANVKKLLSESGFCQIKIVKDYSNQDRVSIACFQ